MDKNFQSLIKSQALQYGDKLFLYDNKQDKNFTYQAYAKIVECVAAHLAQNIKQGESVGYGMDNSWQCAVLIGACLFGGFRAVPINLVSGEDNIAYVTDHSECHLILSDEDHLDMLKSCTAVDVLLISEFITAATKLGASWQGGGVSENDIGLLIYTSGTTARPKGVLLSHKNLYHGGYNCILAHKLTDADKALCSLPLYHINAFCVTLMAPFISGGAVVIDGKFSVARFWEVIAKNKCSWFSLVPTQIAYLTHAESYADFDVADSKSVRFGRSASSSLAPDLQNRFEAKFNVKIIETMGLSETAAQILSNPLEKQKSGSVGIPFGNEVIIADENGKILPPHKEGEIYIKGDNVMCGYLKNDTANAETFTSDGWLRSGDLGYKDEDGFVFVSGRAKELIIKGGENIAPREIDEVLLSFGNLIEVAAFAVPDEQYGEVIAAAVVVDNAEIEAEALLIHCRQKLGDFKSPDKIYFMDSLPKGPSGKIQRLKLAELLRCK